MQVTFMLLSTTTRSPSWTFHLSITGESQDPESVFKQTASLKAGTKNAMKTHMKKAKKTVLNLLDLWM